MVASPKPARGERRPNESMEAMFRRLLVAGEQTSFEFTADEASYVMRRLYETGDPASSPPGDEVVKRFYGLWPESGADHDPEDSPA